MLRSKASRILGGEGDGIVGVRAGRGDGYERGVEAEKGM